MNESGGGRYRYYRITALDAVPDWPGKEGPADELKRIAEDLMKLVKDLLDDRTVLDNVYELSPKAVAKRNDREQECADRVLAEWGLWLLED